MLTGLAGWFELPAAQLIVNAALKAALVLLLGAIVALALRRASSAARHLGWAITVSAALLLPLVSVVVPPWRVLPETYAAALPAAAGFGAQRAVAAAQPRLEAGLSGVSIAEPSDEAGAAAHSTRAIAPASMGVQPAVLDAGAAGPRRSLGKVVLIAWLAGLLITSLAVVLGLIRVHSIRRRARRLRAPVVLQEIAHVARELEIGRVHVLEGNPGAMPMVWGITRPKLLLPSGAHAWPRAMLRAVITHELAHIRRRDAFWQLVADVACCLYWFNPLAWYAARRMRIEREHACDDVVLNAGARASEYARELLDIARSLRSARATSLAAIAMAQPHQLEGRLLAVLDAARERGGVKRAWPAWLAAAVIVVPLAATSPRAHAADTAIPVLGSEETAAQASPLLSERTTRPRLSQQRSSKIAKAAVAVPPASLTESPATQLQEPCAQKGSRSISSNSNGDVKTFKWKIGDCEGTLHMRGRIRLRGDLSGLDSMSPGSDFRLWIKEGRTIRVVTARPDGNGIAYEYTVGGDPRPWNNEGRAWFASALALVVRNTGFAADERVEYLFQREGLSGVLAEVERMSSDYVQRLYLQKVSAKATLNGSALESVINAATRTIESDYELAELLIAIAGRHDFDDATRRAFIGATRTLQSDYEHRRAASAVLKKGGLSADDVAAILTSSQTIKSDWEKAELLLAILGRHELDARMRTIYLASANNMRSDHEKGRVYKQLLRQGTLAPAHAELFLEGVGTLSSDYERAEILRLVPAAALSDATAQQAYLRAVTGMRSDHETRRSLMPLVEAGNLTPATLDVVLTAALDIKSDYERTELLLAVLERHTLTSAQRQRVIEAAERWRSKYEHGRLSSALLRQSRSN